MIAILSDTNLIVDIISIKLLNIKLWRQISIAVLRNAEILYKAKNDIPRYMC